MEKRPFIIGESVYITYLFGEQEPGTVTANTRVIKDDGSDEVMTTAGYISANRLKRDRRGMKLPVYSEVPLR